MEALGSADVTVLLNQWKDGSKNAENELFRRLLPDLRRIARHLLRGERRGHSLGSGDLVNQVYFKLAASKDKGWRDRQHFIRFVARAMRWVLVDHFRKRKLSVVPIEGNTDKLGNHANKSGKLILGLTIDKLLKELEDTEPEWCVIAELKCFLGLTDEEAAEILGLTLRSFQRSWNETRIWLFEKLRTQV